MQKVNLNKGNAKQKALGGFGNYIINDQDMYMNYFIRKKKFLENYQNTV